MLDMSSPMSGKDRGRQVYKPRQDDGAGLSWLPDAKSSDRRRSSSDAIAQAYALSDGDPDSPNLGGVIRPRPQSAHTSISHVGRVSGGGTLTWRDKEFDGISGRKEYDRNADRQRDKKPISRPRSHKGTSKESHKGHFDEKGTSQRPASAPFGRYVLCQPTPDPRDYAWSSTNVSANAAAAAFISQGKIRPSTSSRIPQNNYTGKEDIREKANKALAYQVRPVIMSSALPLSQQQQQQQRRTTVVDRVYGRDALQHMIGHGTEYSSGAIPAPASGRKTYGKTRQASAVTMNSPATERERKLAQMYKDDILQQLDAIIHGKEYVEYMHLFSRYICSYSSILIHSILLNISDSKISHNDSEAKGGGGSGGGEDSIRSQRPRSHDNSKIVKGNTILLL